MIKWKGLIPAPMIMSLSPLRRWCWLRVSKRSCARTYGSEDGKQQYGQLSLVPEAREVLVAGEPIDLSRKEYDLLAYLVENHHLSLSRDQILEAVWGYDYLGSDSTVDTHINRLRNKLKSASGLCGNLARVRI